MEVVQPLDTSKTESDPSKKTPIQLTWVNITITAMPATGRCKPQGALKEKRIIIDNVSGTVLPG